MNKLVFAIALLGFASTAAVAQKYTRQQQEAACSDDAFRLCQDAVPDEAKVVACMTKNRTKLSTYCKLVFDGSMAR